MVFELQDFLNQQILQEENFSLGMFRSPFFFLFLSGFLWKKIEFLFLFMILSNLLKKKHFFLHGIVWSQLFFGETPAAETQFPDFKTILFMFENKRSIFRLAFFCVLFPWKGSNSHIFESGWNLKVSISHCYVFENLSFFKTREHSLLRIHKKFESSFCLLVWKCSRPHFFKKNFMDGNKKFWVF